MRFLTHNTLKCPAKDVNRGYPLRIEIVKMEVRESECNAEFIRHILPSLDWIGVVSAAESVGMPVPTEFDPAYLQDQLFVQAMHRLLLDLHIIDGFLICPESGRRFEIKDGMPNMMLSETEV